jgi:hypothetical protein
MAATAAQPRPAARTVYPVLAPAPAFAVIARGGGRDGDDPDPEPPPSPIEGSAAVDAPAVEPVRTPDGEFPDTVQEYSQAAVAAWAAPDLLRFAELATVTVQDAIIELPDPPNPDWAFIECGAKVTSSECSFYNRDGDHLVLSVAHWRLGEPEAVLRASYDKISFPDDPAAYAEAFITAWLSGNAARMAQLAVPAAAEIFHPTDVDLTEAEYDLAEPDGQTRMVLVSLTGEEAEPVEVELEINLSLLGDTLAIRQAELLTGPAQ